MLTLGGVRSFNVFAIALKQPQLEATASTGWDECGFKAWGDLEKRMGEWEI